MHSEITEMTVDDYAAVRELWEQTDGVGLNDADTREGIEAYLRRNPGVSFVAREGGQLVGAVLCGHDGRRGYLHHLAVSKSHRRQGIGRTLVGRCLAKLGLLGIHKCNIMVFSDNDEGASFWERNGWCERIDLRIRQRVTSNAT